MHNHHPSPLHENEGSSEPDLQEHQDLPVSSIPQGFPQAKGDEELKIKKNNNNPSSCVFTPLSRIIFLTV